MLDSAVLAAQGRVSTEPPTVNPDGRQASRSRERDWLHASSDILGFHGESTVPASCLRAKHGNTSKRVFIPREKRSPDFVRSFWHRTSNSVMSWRLPQVDCAHFKAIDVRSVPVNSAGPRFEEPLVNLDTTSIAHESYYARTDKKKHALPSTDRRESLGYLGATHRGRDARAGRRLVDGTGVWAFLSSPGTPRPSA